MRSEDWEIVSIIGGLLLFLAVIFTTAMTFTYSDAQNRYEHITKCVEMTDKPLECRSAYEGHENE